MCWITITMISPDGRAQLITLPQKRSDQMHLQVFATSMCFRQHPEFFSSYHEICSCLCGERDLLVPVAKCRACTQGYCSVKERRMGIYGERRYLMGFIGTLDTHQKVREQYIHTTVQQRFLGLVIEMVKSSPS